MSSPLRSLFLLFATLLFTLPCLAAGGAEVAHLALEKKLSTKAIPESGEPVRLLMHNVEDYFVAGEQQRSRYSIRPKSAERREAVAEVIASAKPDIVGLIEVGGPLALADLRQRLETRGLDYPYWRVLPREGEDRALAILSRFPIVQDNSVANRKLYQQQKRNMLRGILDVTVKLPDGRLFRLLGVHLKSHVADNAAAADSLRRREADTLALHLRDIARKQKNMPLVVFGDWNDNPDADSLANLGKGGKDKAGLMRLEPADSQGEGWTLFHRKGQEPCTFDHIYVNSVMAKRLEEGAACGIVDIPQARRASGHRAVWCELR